MTKNDLEMLETACKKNNALIDLVTNALYLREQNVSFLEVLNIYKMKLENKTAIVTGASIAKRFAAEGAKVVVNCNYGEEGTEKVANVITWQ
ncbi:hypothetical protein [Mucilaginibacter robiniae]|uniref:hypothetical protein n=1 Tax=Mucilaginibacter robiniae TaxID=2728022 RepID=UPI002006EAD6|nr:hypothetical protein [Mucilaginibacter robiniae]